jgi:glycosyltransferase involved in cell wall biosynthesis
LAALLGSAGYFRRYFTHAWVAGSRQAEYASRLGFARASLVYDFYSADIGQFATVEVARMQAGGTTRRRRFLFVGRFEPVKGLDTLLGAWRRLEGERSGWELHLVGSGSLAATLGAMPGVTVKPFAQSTALVTEFAEAGCFILPSKFEPWGVVVHEAAAAGLPIIASSAVGAADTFLISGHNGYTFRAGESAHLAEMMRRVIAATDGALAAMGLASSRLSTRITPETSAANLAGLLS